LAEDSLIGLWAGEFQKEEKARPYLLRIRQVGDKLSGAMISPRTGGYAFTRGSVDGKTLRIAIERPYKDEEVVFDLRGELDDSGAIRGDLRIAGVEIATYTVRRIPEPAGIWSMRTFLPDRDAPLDSVLTITEGEAGFRAHIKNEETEGELERLGWDDGRIVLAFRTAEGIPIRMAGEFVDNDHLRGRWNVAETDQGGRWEATRRTEPKEVAREKPEAEPKVKPPATPDLAGNWKAIARETEEGDRAFTFTLTGPADALQGKLRGETAGGEAFELALTRSKLEGRRVLLTFELDADGNTLTVDLEGELQPDRSLKGVWKTGDKSGPWSGRRETATF
jgi:hypothetical protein